MGTGCVCNKKNNTSSSSLNQFTLDESKRRKPWTDSLKGYEYFKDPLFHFFSQHPAKYKKLLIEGPPSDLRWSIWKVIFSYKPVQIPEHPINPEYLSLIEKDLTRTFPTHPFFECLSHLESLKEVLINFVRLNPELGYCQGMNLVAGVFLIVSSNETQESSVMMDIFANYFEGKGLFEPGFPKVNELISAFNKAFQQKIPSLYAHFREIELDDQLWISKWMMTLFSYSFKLEAVLRFWDLIFAVGLGAAVNISLTILESLKKQLEGKDLGATIEYFPELRSADVNYDEIVKMSCLGNPAILSPLESFVKETIEEIQHLNIDLVWNLSESLIDDRSCPQFDSEDRKRANSVVIRLAKN